MSASTITQRFEVQGMTCNHCVAAVNQEVAGVPGVVAARADLSSGTLEVDSIDPVDLAAVAEAVEEAGYALVGAER